MNHITDCNEPDCRICSESEPEEQLCLTNHSFDNEGFLQPYEVEKDA